MAAGARLSHSCAASCSGGAHRNLARSRAGFHGGRQRTAEKPRGVSPGPAQPAPRGLQGRPAGGVVRSRCFYAKREDLETLLIGPGESRGEKGGQRAGRGSAQFSRHLVWSRGCARGSGGCAAGAAGSAVGPGAEAAATLASPPC